MCKSLSKRFLAFILTLFIAFICFLPLLTNKNKVLADTETTVSSFTSSNIFVPIKNAGGNYKFYNFSFYFTQERLDSTNTKINFGFNVLDLSSLQIFSQISLQYLDSSGDVLNSSILSDVFGFEFIVNSQESIAFVFARCLFDGSRYITVLFRVDNGYLDLINRIDFSHNENSNLLTYCKIDSSELVNDVITFSFESSDDLFFNQRSYFLNTGAINEQIFQNGVAEGERTGYDNGFREGKQLGFIEGHAQGLNEGLSSNGNSFLNLIGAVVDAPIQALAGILNFNLLGFNMLNLFYGVITLIILIGIIRLVL